MSPPGKAGDHTHPAAKRQRFAVAGARGQALLGTQIGPSCGRRGEASESRYNPGSITL